jgi:hypothetical protein
MTTNSNDDDDEIDFDQLRSDIFHIVGGQSARTRRLAAQVDYLERESKHNPKIRAWLQTTKFPRKQKKVYEPNIEKIMKDLYD